jgi:hypothetical protein
VVLTTPVRFGSSPATSATCKSQVVSHNSAQPPASLPAYIQLFTERGHEREDPEPLPIYRKSAPPKLKPLVLPSLVTSSKLYPPSTALTAMETQPKSPTPDYYSLYPPPKSTSTYTHTPTPSLSSSSSLASIGMSRSSSPSGSSHQAQGEGEGEDMDVFTSSENLVDRIPIPDHASAQRVATSKWRGIVGGGSKGKGKVLTNPA